MRTSIADMPTALLCEKTIHFSQNHVMASFCSEPVVATSTYTANSIHISKWFLAVVMQSDDGM
jgi:hypothetical protein